MMHAHYLLPMLLLPAAGFAGEQVIETIVAPATENNRRNTEGDLVVLKDGTYLLAWSDFFGGARDDSAGASRRYDRPMAAVVGALVLHFKRTLGNKT